MELKDPKFLGFRDDRLYFDITIVDGNSEIPYTYLDSDNPTEPLDIFIKTALKTGNLVIDTSVVAKETEETPNSETQDNPEKAEFDLWRYRNWLYGKFRKEFYEIIGVSHVEYKEHLFALNDINFFNSYYIINKHIKFTDLQNLEIELEQSDFKNILELAMAKRESIMLQYHDIKNKLSKANTKEELDSIQWDLSAV